MVHNQQFSKLELMQGRVRFIPDNWKFMHVEKAYTIRNNLRLPINGTDRDSNPGPYPYYGPTKIQGYIGSYEQNGDFVLIGEDGDHFLKYKWQVMTQLVEGKCTVNNHAHILEETDVAIRKWFYYYFMHRDIFSFLTRQGAGRFKLNKAALAKLPVLIPPLPEQKKIAKILSTWDKAITTTEQLIANSQQQKKALMQQLLTGKKRLAGFSGEWEEVTIQQFGAISSGGTPSTKVSSYWNGDVFWMTPTDVTALKSRFITNTKRKITIEGVNNSSATILPARSLLVCTRATIGLMSISTCEITTNQGFKNIVPNKNYDVGFLYYLFNNFKNELIRYACGSTFLELSKKDFERIKFLTPLLKEQQKIVQVLSSADQEIETLQQKLSFLKEEKKALMQQLLTGKRRVKLDD